MMQLGCLKGLAVFCVCKNACLKYPNELCCLKILNTKGAIMDVNSFWNLIDKVKQQCGELDDIYDMTTPLVNELAALDLDDIVIWHNILSEYQQLSYKEKLWAAAYVINGGCSDDGFDYFRGWLTAQGRDVFHNALRDPDSLADVDAAREDECGFEDILGVALLAWHQKQGLAKRDYDAFYSACEQTGISEAIKAEIAAGIEYDADIDCEWDDDDEDSLLAVVPRLCAKFDW